MSRPPLLRAAFSCLLLVGGLAGSVAAGPRTATPIEHLVVLIQQSQSFDRYFGTYPGADGIPPGVCMPVDPFDRELAECIEPFYLGTVPAPELAQDPETFRLQYNDGKMDGFVYAQERTGREGSLAMGYYDDRALSYYWNLADEYVLFDRFFSSAHGGSAWNPLFAVAAVAGSEDNRIPPGGYGDLPTIFDLLQERGIPWKFYVSGYDPGLNYRTVGEVGMLMPQVLWVPLLGFDRFLDDPERAARIVDLEEYFEDLDRGTLPAVSYLLTLGATEHPRSDLRHGQRSTRRLIQALMASDAWSRSAFLLTYDDWGGAYDHVPPPQVDDHGYGFRVPALLVSPYAPRGRVDGTVLDFTSILRFIEDNWSLPSLAARDAAANSIAAGLDFSQPPREPRFLPFERPQEETVQEPRRAAIYATYGVALGLALAILAWGLRTDRGRPSPPGWPRPGRRGGLK